MKKNAAFKFGNRSKGCVVMINLFSTVDRENQFEQFPCLFSSISVLPPQPPPHPPPPHVPGHVRFLLALVMLPFKTRSANRLDAPGPHPIDIAPPRVLHHGNYLHNNPLPLPLLPAPLWTFPLPPNPQPSPPPHPLNCVFTNRAETQCD